MDAAAALAELYRRGGEAVLKEDGALRYRLPRSQYDPALAAALAASREQLRLDLLEAEEFSPYGLWRCRSCRQIQAARWFEEPIIVGLACCDECRALPAVPEQLPFEASDREGETL